MLNSVYRLLVRLARLLSPPVIMPIPSNKTIKARMNLNIILVFPVFLIIKVSFDASSARTIKVTPMPSAYTLKYKIPFEKLLSARVRVRMLPRIGP